MPNVRATAANAFSIDVWVVPSRKGSNTTRMKKRPRSTSPNCADSTMLQSERARNVPTAPTMPGRSVQDSVRTRRGEAMLAASLSVRVRLDPRALHDVALRGEVLREDFREVRAVAVDGLLREIAQLLLVARIGRDLLARALDLAHDVR